MSVPGILCPCVGAFFQALSPCHGGRKPPWHWGLIVVVVGSVCLFSHGIGWVPPIASPAHTRGGQDLCSPRVHSHCLPGLCVGPAQGWQQAQPLPGSCRARLAVTQPWYDLGVVELNLARGKPVQDLVACWLCGFVLDWEGEQHPGLGEAGLLVPLGRDGGGCCCLQCLGAALLLAPGWLHDAQNQQLRGTLLPLHSSQPSGHSLRKLGPLGAATEVGG